MPHSVEQIRDYIKQAVDQIEPIDQAEIEDKKKIKNHLVLHAKDFYDRQNIKGHITATGIVFHNDNVVLVHHKKLNKWLQPGGHCEEGEMPYETAARKIEEETGITDLNPLHLNEDNQPLPFYCAVDLIPEYKSEIEHKHLDLLYVFETKQEDLLINDESSEVKWFNKGEAKKINEKVKKVILKMMGRVII